MNADSNRDHARHGLWVSLVSVAWTLVISAVEVVLGLNHHILTLVVFGAAGTLDAAGSVALAVHFRHAVMHDHFAEHHERRATLVVSCGLMVLGMVTAIESVRRLVQGGHGSHTGVGTALAGASAVVLVVLAAMKRRIGRRIESAAMVADAALSMSGCLLGLLAVAGATFGTSPSTAWVDPAAALLIAVAAGAYGTLVLVRGSSS